MTTGNFVQFDKRIALLLFAVGIWIWIIYSIKSHSSDKIIKALIIQSRTPIRSIDSPIKPFKKETLWIDTLYFPKGTELRHPKYGYLGYRRDFIIHFDTDMELKKDGFVKFTIYSDDGFRLWVDNKKIMEYPKDRPFSKSQKTVKLSKGKHHIHIKYFQGFGQLGVVGYYSYASTFSNLKDSKLHLIGKNSSPITFIEK